MESVHPPPKLYEGMFQIPISVLKEHGYLVPGTARKGTLTWHKEGKSVGSLLIEVDTCAENPFIELSYTHDGANLTDRIALTAIRSNLGKGGSVWYFTCPRTKKLCTKLYFMNGYFSHRTAAVGRYETETRSRKYKALLKTVEPPSKLKSLYAKLGEKNFKTTYKGKPTKRYLKIVAKIQQAESITPAEISKAIADFATRRKAQKASEKQ